MGDHLSFVVTVNISCRQGILLMNGTSQLVSLLAPHEALALALIIGIAAVNALGYAIAVDFNS